jgi:DNA-binding MurR/RpiR family transcriptional regulator
MLAYEQLDPDTGAALTRANELDLPVVMITDTLGEKLADRVDAALEARRSRRGALSSATTTMVLLDALLLALADRDRARSLAALAELNELRKRVRAVPLAGKLP